MWLHYAIGGTVGFVVGLSVMGYSAYKATIRAEALAISATTVGTLHQKLEKVISAIDSLAQRVEKRL